MLNKYEIMQKCLKIDQRLVKKNHNIDKCLNKITAAPWKEGIVRLEVEKLLDFSLENRIVTQFFDFFFLSLK